MSDLDPNRPLATGDIIHGFANGAFGSNSYSCRRIEAVGPDWIVVRYDGGGVDIAEGHRTLKLCQDNREPLTDPYGDAEKCCDFTPQITTWRPSS